MRLPKPIQSAYDLMKTAVEGYSEDHGSLVAAAVSFYVFLSLIPLLLLAVAIAGFVLGSPKHAQELLFANIGQYSPSLAEKGGGAAIIDVIKGVIAGRGAATGFSLLMLLWTGTSLITHLSQGVNIAWDVPVRRGFLGERIRGLVLLLLVGVLMIISVGATALFRTIQKLDIKVFGTSPAEWSWLWDVLGYLIPLLVTIGAFTLIYKLLPHTRVKLSAALFGGVFAGILWEIAKQAYSFYVANFAHYSAVYGSLGAVILLLVWINYSSAITMLGAEVGSTWERRHRASP